MQCDNGFDDKIGFFVSSSIRGIIIAKYNIQWKWPRYQNDLFDTFHLPPSTFADRYMWPRLLFIDGYEATWTARYIFSKATKKK